MALPCLWRQGPRKLGEGLWEGALGSKECLPGGWTPSYCHLSLFLLPRPMGCSEAGHSLSLMHEKESSPASKPGAGTLMLRLPRAQLWRVVELHPSNTVWLYFLGTAPTWLHVLLIIANSHVIV